MASSLRQTRIFILLLSILNLFLSVHTLPAASPEDESSVHALDSRATNYLLAVADQTTNTIRVFPRNSEKWNQDAIDWSFTAGGGAWDNLSDVKIRKIANHGWIALVCASGGKAALINITNEKRHVKVGDREVLWQASPGGNPHSIERVPHKGVIATAGSNPGKLTLYVPTTHTSDDVNDFGKIEKGREYKLAGAHGVLWDPTGEHLWAVGDKVLNKYTVEGKRTGTKLALVKSYKIPGNGMGHDLQPDFTEKNTLLVTDTYGAYAFNTGSGEWTTLKEMRKIKSLVREPDGGEYFWVVGNVDELGQKVEFGGKVGSADDSRGWSDARFYKARLYSTAFE